MPITGYPIGSVKGELLQVTVDSNSREMEEGENFARRFPPEAGDQLYRVVAAIRQAAGFVFKEEVPMHIPGNQRWKIVEGEPIPDSIPDSIPGRRRP